MHWKHTQKNGCLVSLHWCQWAMSLRVTAGYALGFIWCDGSGGNANRRSFQTAKRGVRLVGRRSHLSGWKLFLNTNNHRDFPLFSSSTPTPHDLNSFCVQYPVLWAVKGAEGGGVMFDWNPRTTVSFWCSDGIYKTTLFCTCKIKIKLNTWLFSIRHAWKKCLNKLGLQLETS